VVPFVLSAKELLAKPTLFGIQAISSLFSTFNDLVAIFTLFQLPVWQMWHSGEEK